MPLCDLQKFLENSVHGACVPVDLLKIAKSVGYRRQARGGTRGPYSAAASPLTLVVDGECCLDRLYGGFFSDWVCGGQWNRMVQFLVVLIQTVQNNNIELAVFFNGSLEQQRLGEWAQIQSTNRKHINSVLRHVSVKGTPPPKVWWIAPTGLRMCLRMALRHLGIQVVCTMDDHHQEVIAFCRENGYHGLMAEDAEYIIFDPPRYFSSHQLKLTYKGSLETKEFILDEIEKGLNLPRSYFCFLATLLGNYLLTENDLADFYSTIIAGYNKEQNTQEDIIRAVVKFITNNCDVNNLMTIGAQVFGSVSDPRVAKFKESVQYFLNGTKDGFLQYKPVPPGRRDIGMSLSQYRNPDYHQRGGESQINKKDVKGGRLTTDEFSPQINTSINPLPPVPHEVNRTASERHQKGLMSPWIYQVINQGEVKFEPSLQDEMCSEFPPAVIFFRPVRQYVYAILFNLHHHSFMARKAKEEGQKAASVPEIGIREWVYTKENPYRFSELTEALPINWAVPTVQRLWFGTIIDDKKRRLRAFLSCLHSDSPLMLHTAYVPQHMLVMATVLRFIMSRNEMPVLRRQEVDAFLVTAFSPDLTNAQYLQDLQIPSLNPRGVQLASFFMVGVEMAHFANDACGSPIPWLMCCPWNFFDGKLFHSILLKANCSRNLMEICDGDMELVNKVERCREAIFEGLNVKLLQCFSMPPAPGTAMSVQQQQQQQFSGAPPSYPYPNQNMRLKGRGHPGRGGGGIGRLYSRGGQLQVAGIVVGQWGPNFGTANSRHSQDGYTAGRDRYNSPMRMGKPSVRGRPSVLAKRRMIKRKDVRTPKGRPQQPLHPSHPVESSQIVEPPQPCQPTQSILQDYDSQADDGENFVTISHSQTNGGDYATYNYATDPNNETQLYAAHPENSDLAPFHSHPCNNNHNNNNGLKSPDSGVNVSILE